MTVVSKVGGGVLAWAYLNQHPGDGAYISISPINLIIEHILGASPITQLFNEYVAFGVKPESPLRSMKDVMERLKSDPASVSFAFAASLGGANHIATSPAAKKAGVEPRKLKLIVFSSASQVVTAVLGSHLDVAVVAVSGAAPHFQAGRIRVIGVSSAQRLPGAFAAVPTRKEQGCWRRLNIDPGPVACFLNR